MKLLSIRAGCLQNSESFMHRKASLCRFISGLFATTMEQCWLRPERISVKTALMILIMLLSLARCSTQFTALFLMPGESASDYEGHEYAANRIIAVNGIELGDEIRIMDPVSGKISQIDYQDEEQQTETTYTVTKADGGIALNVLFAHGVTVTFDSNGGSVVDPQTIVKGSTAARPEDPTRSGYTFAGWTLNGADYDFSQPVNSDITLVATWNLADPSAILRSAYLSLEGKISINFKVQAPDAGYVARLYYEKNGFEQVAEVPLDSEHFVVDPDEYDHYLVTYSEIPAKEMTQQLRIKIYDSEGNPVQMKTSTGRLLDLYDYSVSKWCLNKINAANPVERDVMIAKALLNYGHYSQLALKYNDGVDGRPQNMPDAWLESEMGSVTANSAYDRITTGGGALGAKTFILVLESDTLIKLVLGRQVDVAIDGTAVTPVPETDSSGNNIWAAYSRGVAAKRMHELKPFVLTEGSNSATMYYGVLSWANSKLANGSEDDQNLARAMYLYNAAARKYFNYDAAGL